MSDPVDLDKRRGMMAQKETDERRTLSGARADQAVIAERQIAFENLLASTPATTQHAAVTKAMYLLKRHAETEGLDPRRARLIALTLDELEKLFGADADL